MKTYELIEVDGDWELTLYVDDMPVSGASFPGEKGKATLQKMADEFMADQAG